ncbi:hypothetical protein B0I35DRAFT_474876 [Stachybotrys elegans]|uniref:25S rRNA (Uridine(2843)-N(3))-methyltransferase n=1 Tax=Stachybotrys elegans TaxID=80388 RepID=A0A8K0WWT3_9HYPO|nr:hypothetical protein B0I35DRAFT_474876 [Stachybotrys elegans]
MVKKAPSKKPARKPKDPTPAKTDAGTSVPPAPQLSAAEQQRLLDIFSAAFDGVLNSADFSDTLQGIKQALFNRDFATAFGREEYLEAYAARWSPTRALAYATVLLGIEHHIRQSLLVGDVQNDAGNDLEGVEQAAPTGEEPSPNAGPSFSANGNLKMLSIGGCAAEHLAFASFLCSTSTTGHLTLLDSAPWSQVTSLLQTHITTPPSLSKYASAAAKANNAALLNVSDVSVEFMQQDALSLDSDKLETLTKGTPLLITLLFTLNELYTSGGLGKTTKFLKALGGALPHGSLLLVVDSPGSYSETAIGQEKKRYPMQWLLSHTLLETASDGYTWDKLESHDSVWFRVPEGLSYPIPLENMRYQMHLYRISKDSSSK